MLRKIVCMLSLSVLIAACSGSNENAQKPVVFVSILPQAYFAERIAGEHLRVEVMVGPGQSPHSFEPTPKQMASLSESEAFLTIDMPFEETLVPRIKASNPELEIFDTTKRIESHEMPEGHGHSEGHEHGADEKDPHIWLSPKLAIRISENICEAFKKITPKYSTDFDKNLDALKKDLKKLDGNLKETLEPLKGRKLYVFHPAFGYFAESYGMDQVAVETGGKEPGAKKLGELIEKAKKDDVKIIFVQPQFSQSGAEAIAREIDGAVIPMDPLEKNYIENMKSMAEKIMKALSGENSE